MRVSAGQDNSASPSNSGSGIRDRMPDASILDGALQGLVVVVDDVGSVVGGLPRVVVGGDGPDVDDGATLVVVVGPVDVGVDVGAGKFVVGGVVGAHGGGVATRAAPWSGGDTLGAQPKFDSTV